MTEVELYKGWPYRTRYLQRACWKAIKRQIYLHKITSVLEFGSGLSTILFNHLGLNVVSYDTDINYLRIVKSFNLSNVEFRLWNNKEIKIDETFGLSLVDGILPRTNQLYYAQKHSRYIAIDDFTDPESNKGLEQMLSDYKQIAGFNTKLAVFRRF